MLRGYPPLIFILAMLTWASPVFSQSVPETISIQGRDGVYIFTDPAISDGAYNRIVIERRLRNRDSWQKVGETTGPLPVERFSATAGFDLTQWLIEVLPVNNEQELNSYLRQNSNLEEYGLSVLFLPFMEAMGRVVTDRDMNNIGPDSTIYYRAHSFDPDGNLVNEFYWTHSLIIREHFPKPLVIAKSESDSIITIAWRAPISDDNWPVWAEVYRTEAVTKREELLVDRIMAQVNEKGDSVYYYFAESPVSGFLYRYHIVPLNYAGLPGVPSDTVAVISRSTGSVRGIEDLQSVDSLGGIFLSWMPMDPDPLVAGWIIERANNPEGTFIALDTIGNRINDYLDLAVLQASTYYYRIRPHGVRLEEYPHSAWITHTFYNRGALILPPRNVRAQSSESGALLSWDEIPGYGIAGYFVLRRPEEETEWETVSPLIEETRFIDSSDRLHAHTTYAYAIQAISINDDESPVSEVVYFRPDLPVELPRPEGLLIASGVGQNSLRWLDMRIYMQPLKSYRIYRKNSDEDFRENPDITAVDLREAGFAPIAEVENTTHFIDYHLPPRESFIYAITIVDLFENEGPPAFSYPVSYDMPLLPPTWFGLRNTPEGIEISWDRGLAEIAPEIIILRREQTQTQSTELITLHSGQGIHYDNPSAGNLFFYSLQLKEKARTSEPTIEKSIRKLN